MGLGFVQKYGNFVDHRRGLTLLQVNRIFAD